MPVNMSYCRFENTLSALRECDEALGQLHQLDELPERECIAARHLVRLCAAIARDWAPEDQE